MYNIYSIKCFGIKFDNVSFPVFLAALIFSFVVACFVFFALYQSFGIWALVAMLSLTSITTNGVQYALIKNTKIRNFCGFVLGIVGVVYYVIYIL